MMFSDRRVTIYGRSALASMLAGSHKRLKFLCSDNNEMGIGDVL